MLRHPLLKGGAIAIACMLLGPGGCQDYGFEELPSSVIREKRFTVTVSVSQDVDILFVIDNSRSMVGEQLALAASFRAFTDVLDEKFGEDRYRIAVVTTGMESLDCGPCPPDETIYSCINDTGENGRFQDRLGHNVGTIDNPHFEFVTDQSCRVITSANLDCFYDEVDDQGVVFVGTRGCGYEKGLAPVRAALSQPLIDSWNANFLRDNATLAVVVVTDEEDCGEVGDITEQIMGISGKACYYAAKGVAPDGSLSDPVEGRPYELTPVRDYYDFLVDLKGGRASLVKFAAIVGTDPEGPEATEIEYESDAPTADSLPACFTPDCTGEYCEAKPGTRYLELVELFGDNGFSGTICQPDFSDTMEALGTFIACPEEFKLSEEILDPGLANILVNDVAVPRYSCSGSSQDDIEVCSGPNDDTCSAGDCVETWSYQPPSDPPDPDAPGGLITFADHYDPCNLIAEGDINIELIYVTR